MMGRQSKVQNKLFYTAVNLEKRIRKDHLLRAVDKLVDFNFIYKQVQDRYGVKGNVSVPPPVILKMMLLLILYNVRSERELMDTIPERLDWLWFLGYDLDDDIPDHSVLSKARSRWGVEAFKTFFEYIVIQCIEAGLVDGTKLFTDASLMDANASNNSVCKGPEVLIEQLRQELRREIVKLEEPAPPPADVSTGTDPATADPALDLLPAAAPPASSSPPPDAGAGLALTPAAPPPRGSKKYYRPKNRGLVSTTDPDAAIVRKGALGPRARYKNHRAVDDLHGVITALETTAGDVEENAKLMDLIDQHERNTSCRVEVAVADTQYGTVENFRACQQRGILSHMADLSQTQADKFQKQGIFGIEQFVYDPPSDTYRCPAGQTLTRRKHKKQRQAYEYACAAATCQACSRRPHCTRARKPAARTA